MHKAMEDVEIGGYKFSKGTEFCGNFMGTHFDPEYWEEPGQFMPQRFLDPEGRILTETPNFFPLFTSILLSVLTSFVLRTVSSLMSSE